jgi:hypothetical protein
MEKRPPRFHRRPKDPGDDNRVDASAVSTLTYYEKDLNEKTLQRKNEISPTESQQQQQWQQHDTNSTAQQQRNNNQDYITSHCRSSGLYHTDNGYHSDANDDCSIVLI